MAIKGRKEPQEWPRGKRIKWGEKPKPTKDYPSVSGGSTK